MLKIFTLKTHDKALFLILLFHFGVIYQEAYPKNKPLILKQKIKSTTFYPGCPVKLNYTAED